MNVYLIVLAAYAALMVLLGAWVSRRTSGSSNFFVASRNLGAGYLFATLLAANIGAGSTVGATGLGYQIGFSAWWWVGSAGIGSAIFAITVAPRIWTVARDQNLYTVGDYFEYRYDRRIRHVTAIFLWFGSLAILSAQLIAIASIINVVTGAQKLLGCVLAAIVVTTYFAVGGLHSTVRVNVLQLSVKLIGFALAIAFVVKSFGIGGVTAAASRNLSSDQIQTYFGFAGIGVAGVLRYVFTLGPSFIVSPGLIQKVFGGRDQKAVRRGVGLNAICLLLFAMIPVGLGIFARGQFTLAQTPDSVLPLVLTRGLPVTLGAFLMAAIFSAELSAADAVLFMLTTSLGKDLYKSLLRPKVSDEELLRFTRWSVVICGALAALCAILLQTVIDALTIFYTLLTAVYFLPVVVGLYWRRATGNAALLSILTTTGTVIFFKFALLRSDFLGVPSIVIALLVGLLVIVGVSLMAPAASNRKAIVG